MNETAELKLRMVGAGLMTPKIAELYAGKYPEVNAPWWLCEEGSTGGMQFVNAYGQINTRGGDSEAMYGVRPVLAVLLPGVEAGDTVELPGRRTGEQPETFTCIWTMDANHAMIFSDRIIADSTYRRDGGKAYRGSDAEKVVIAFTKNIEGRPAVIHRHNETAEQDKG
jgi:hypothetical protein